MVWNAAQEELRIIGVLASIYLFLMGLDMMGSSFLVLGGKGAGELFTILGSLLEAVVLRTMSVVSRRFCR